MKKVKFKKEVAYFPWKVGIAWESKNKSGGGFSFTSVLRAGLGEMYTDDWKDSDVVLIPSASVITKELFREIKSTGIPTVLRIDNSLKDSRNRGGGMSKLLEFGRGATEVVYQGSWCRRYLSGYIEREGVIIHNGVDLSVFTSEGDREVYTDDKSCDVYLYSNASGGENKGWHSVWYQFQDIHRTSNARLVIVGKVDGQVDRWGYDFFNGERYHKVGYINPQDREAMARVYRGCKYMFASYQYDAFSQTYIEALCCGLELKHVSLTGGTPEILSLYDENGRMYFDKNRMISEYVNLFDRVVNG